MKYIFLILLLGVRSNALDVSKVDLDIVQKEAGNFGTQIFILYYGKCKIQKEFEEKDYQSHQNYINSKDQTKSSKIQSWMNESLKFMNGNAKCN